MARNIVARSLNALPPNPEQYVKEHFEELRKKYGDSLVAVKGDDVILTGANVETLIEQAEAEAWLPGPKVIVGALESIRTGSYWEVKRRTHPAIADQESRDLATGNGYDPW